MGYSLDRHPGAPYICIPSAPYICIPSAPYICHPERSEGSCAAKDLSPFTAF